MFRIAEENTVKTSYATERLTDFDKLNFLVLVVLTLKPILLQPHSLKKRYLIQKWSK